MPSKRALLLAVCLLSWAPFTSAAEPPFDAARLMPSTVIAYTQWSHPKPLLDVVLDPRWADIAATLPQGQKYFQSKEYQQMLSVVQMLEGKLGEKWPSAVRGLLDGGAYFGIDPLNKGGILIVRARDAALLKEANDAALELVEAAAKDKGQPSPVKSGEHHGTTGWSIGNDVQYAIVDNLLFVSNKADGLKFAVDRYKGKSGGTLDKAEDFQQARKLATSEDGAVGEGTVQGWGMLRLAPLKLIPGVSKALNGPRDNPGAEYLLGGVFEPLKHAPFVVWNFGIANNKLALRARIPFDASKVAENRRWFFAADGKESAAVPLRPPGMLVTFTAYRDLGGMWTARDELFDANVAQSLSQGETQLGLFFSGQDFTTDILNEMSPRTRWVVARQTFAAGGVTPSIKIPAFATVVEMKNSEEFGTRLLVGYQKLVGLLNITGSIEQGLPSLIMDTESFDGVTIHRSKYLAGKDVDKKHAEIVFNFSPACAQVGNYFVAGSTTAIVKDLVTELKTPQASQKTSDNVLLEFDLQQGAEALQDNLDTLITQNMLTEGSPREEAERNVQLGLTVLRQMKTSALRLTHGEQSLTLELSFGLPEADKMTK